MQIHHWGHLALSFVIAIGGAGVASAQEPIEHSHGVANVAVCARGVARGEARCFAHVQVDSDGVPRNGRASPNVTPSGFSPSDLRSAYKTTTTTGSSMVAIVDAYGYPNAEADLAVYRAQYGLPACTTANGCFTKVNQRGQTSSYPRNNTGWAQESALDLDMVSAMCPDCSIILVEADSNSFANLAAAVDEAAALGAHVISNSYGGGESGSATYNSSYTHGGVAVTASSGDSGYGVSFPASSPGVIAVGGTHLTRSTNSRGWSETAWSGAGSGCSTVYAKPTWQTDTGCSKRVEADVSAVADPATGVAVYGPTGHGTRSGWLVFGGTSVAAPLIGGVYGLKNSTVNAAQSLYNNRTSLNDVTSGSNGNCGTYICNAGAGYDGPTGLGTPIGITAF